MRCSENVVIAGHSEEDDKVGAILQSSVLLMRQQVRHNTFIIRRFLHFIQNNCSRDGGQNETTAVPHVWFRVRKYQGLTTKAGVFNSPNNEFHYIFLSRSFPGVSD